MDHEELTDEELGLTGEIPTYNDGYAERMRAAFKPAPIIGKWVGNPELPGVRQRARDAAKAKRLPEYVAPCHKHGDDALNDTETGACLLCLAENLHLPASVRYKTSGGTCYIDICPEHGEAVHRFGRHTCHGCRDDWGRARTGAGARALARRQKLPSYIGRCETHGEVPFGVNSGKCLSCFTTMGWPRSDNPAGRPIDDSNPRAVARRGGERKFIDNCELHGAGPHSVMHGRCLRCFTAAGVKRKAQ